MIEAIAFFIVFILYLVWNLREERRHRQRMARLNEAIRLIGELPSFPNLKKADDTELAKRGD